MLVFVDDVVVVVTVIFFRSQTLNKINENEEESTVKDGEIKRYCVSVGMSVSGPQLSCFVVKTRRNSNIRQSSLA